MSRKETRDRLDRLSPSMKELLISMLHRNTYPVDSNQSRTFYALEERGLIQPDFYEIWALTDEGHKTALNLLRR